MKNRPYYRGQRGATVLVRILLDTRRDGSTAAENDVIIYMDDYRKAQAMDVAAHRRYDEELLCANWNPAIRVLATSWYQTSREISPDLPEDLARIDADGFLDRVYALATQV